jgi:hydrogenase nickel incorporation protein HypB
MRKKKSIGKKILSANEEYALENSRILSGQKKLCLNMISSPGSGKTTILARTISELKDKIRIGVIEGDIQTDLDD